MRRTLMSAHKVLGNFPLWAVLNDSSSSLVYLCVLSNIFFILNDIGILVESRVFPRNQWRKINMFVG